MGVLGLKVGYVSNLGLTPDILSASGKIWKEHELETKAKAANKFLSQGDKVKIVLRFRGRQLTHVEVGEETMNKFIELVSEEGTIEKPAVLEGKLMTVIMGPKKKK